MESKPEKWEKSVGVIFGILLFIIWAFCLTAIFHQYFPGESLFKIPVYVWLLYSSPVFFGYFGIYLFYSRKFGGFESLSKLIFLKSYLLGSLFWILITGIFFMHPVISNLVIIIGGFIIIFTIFGIWSRIAKKKNPEIFSGRPPFWRW